jgi:hypothetical protein
MRRAEEFWCSTHGGGCGQYFTIHIREDMWGPYTIECPNCHHAHHRFIGSRDGKILGTITDDRVNDQAGHIDRIIGLKSTLHNVPFHDDPEFRRSNIRALP